MRKKNKALLFLFSLLFAGCSTVVHQQSLIPVGEKIYVSESDALTDINITIKKMDINKFVISKNDLEKISAKCIQRKERIKELLLLINEHNRLLEITEKTISTDEGH